MGTARPPEPELLLVAAFSRHGEALCWARRRLAAAFGPVCLASPAFPFTQTNYYEPTMGPGLRKVFYGFRDLVPPETLAAIKRHTNELEAQLAAAGRHAEPRPLNLDPGLLSLGKFVLATTKNQAHRIYLRDGIYAEVTLCFQDGQFHPWPWTYADYRQPAVLDFLKSARAYYRSVLRSRTRTMNDE